MLWDKNRRKAYEKGICRGDYIFVRGVLTPYVLFIYLKCKSLNKPLIHWIGGNPYKLLSSHNRNGFFLNSIGKLLVLFWENKLHLGHRLHKKSYYLCNGTEIADRHKSQRCSKVVSTTLESKDFRYKEDTCLNSSIIIATLCFIRPEKGIEYLIEAFSFLKIDKCKLIIHGDRSQYPVYQKKLDNLILKLGLEDRVEFTGLIEGCEVMNKIHEADIFVLPSLSEGTPRVLIESQAVSTPLISTSVGGIPDSIENNFNGLLVSPANSTELKNAIEKIYLDSCFRKSLIKNGIKISKTRTLTSFANLINDRFSTMEIKDD